MGDRARRYRAERDETRISAAAATAAAKEASESLDAEKDKTSRAEVDFDEGFYAGWIFFLLFGRTLS